MPPPELRRPQCEAQPEASRKIFASSRQTPGRSRKTPGSSLKNLGRRPRSLGQTSVGRPKPVPFPSGSAAFAPSGSAARGQPLPRRAIIGSLTSIAPMAAKWPMGAEDDRDGFIPAGAMAPQTMRDLVGRVMIDSEFLSRLVRSPETTLADFELDDGERAIVMQALARLEATPLSERPGAFRSAMVRRLAT
jgi:hypothetical protein